MQTIDDRKKQPSILTSALPYLIADQRCSCLQNQELEMISHYSVGRKIWLSSHRPYFLCTSQKVYAAKL